MTTMFRWTVLIGLMVVPFGNAWAQYQATPRAGISYPSLTNPVRLALTAPGTNNPNDRGRATVALGFDFPFYDRLYQRLTVTANGLLFLEPSSGSEAASDFSANVALRNATQPNGLIAPLWDDLIGNNANSVVQTQSINGAHGVGLAVEFKDWNRVFGVFNLTFQVRLWADGIVEFFYGPMTGSGATAMTATIGIESPSGSAGTAGLSGCTTDCSLISFDPQGTGTPINSIRFGPPEGIDLQAMSLRIDGIEESDGDLSISTTFTMRNFGTIASGPFTYGLFLSEDTAFDLSDQPLLPSPTGPFDLGPLSSSNHSHAASIHKPDGGSWYVLAAIPELVGGETNSSNNVIASTVPYAAGVDLIAESLRPPTVAGPGDVVNLELALSNQGFEPAGAVSTKFYASVDSVLSVDDRLLTSQVIDVLGGEQVRQSVSFVLPGTTPADDYHVIMQLDDGPAAGAIAELNESNNVVSSVTKMQVRQADLAVTAVRILRADAPHDELSYVFFGDSIRAEALVLNAGGATAPNVHVDFFISDNGTLNALSDIRIGSASNVSLAPGESRWVTIENALIPVTNLQGQPLAAQSYFFFAAAFGVGLVEANGQPNFEKSRPTLVRGPAPNLVAVDIQTPSRAGANELIVVSRTLANLGNRDVTGVKYRYYLSANPVVTAVDIPLTVVTSVGDAQEGTVSLAIGQSDSAVELLRLPQTLADAPMYIGVLLDPEGVIDEVEKTDNGVVGGQTNMLSQPLTLANAVLPDATVNLPYSVQLSGAGNRGPFGFTLADPAALPLGLTLSIEGLLSGMPTQAGAFMVLLKVAAEGKEVVVARSLRVSNVTTSLAINRRPLPAPSRFVPYHCSLGAAGGAGFYSYQVVSGLLPVGLALSSDGDISGTPTEPLGTTRGFVVRVTDAVGNIDSSAFSVTIVDAAPFALNTHAIADGVVGQEYAQALVAINGSGAPVSLPVLWKVIEGTLPPGLAFEPSSSDGVTISGTPNRPGRYGFTVEVTDGQGRTDSFSYGMSISAGAVVITATGPLRMAPGESASLAFSAEGIPDEAKWFWLDGRLPPGLNFSTDGTVSGQVNSDAELGVYSFSVGVGLGAEQLLSRGAWSFEVSNEGKAAAGCSSIGSEGWYGVLFVLAQLRRHRVSKSLY